MLLMLRRVLKHADTKTQKTVYSSLVRPILEYGCIVWDHFLKNNIKTFKKRLKLEGQVSFMEIRENTGTESLAKRREDLWFKCYLSSVNRDLSVPDFGGFKECHNTQQHNDPFVPTIRTNEFSD